MSAGDRTQFMATNASYPVIQILGVSILKGETATFVRKTGGEWTHLRTEVLPPPQMPARKWLDWLK